MARPPRIEGARLEIFATVVITHWNLGEAAIAAGYAPKYARHTGWKLMQQDEVQEAVNKALKERMTRLKLDADTVLRDLACMALVDVTELHNDDWSAKGKQELTHDQRRAIVGVKRKQTEYGVEIEFRLAKPEKITEALKHLGLLKENVVHSGQVTLEMLVPKSIPRPARVGPPLDAKKP